MSEAVLTVAIPTYNRASHLEARLKELVPQLTNKVCIRVFDNCSADNTREVVLSIAHPAVTYFRSLQNMGMCRNICRGLEEAETEWVWILGDDDPVTPTAIADALRWLEETSATVIQFDSTGGKIERRDLISSLDELYMRHDPIRTLYISSLLFRVPPLRKAYLLLSAAIFTYGPHTALIIRMLEQGIGSLELRPETLLAKWFGGKNWSSLEVALGLSLLPEFVLDREMQKVAARNLRIDLCWMIVYGLREVRDVPSARKWRRIAYQSIANLRAYGARRLVAGSRWRRPLGNERKDFWLSLVFPLLPDSVLIRFGERMRKKHNETKAVLVELG